MPLKFVVRYDTLPKIDLELQPEKITRRPDSEIDRNLLPKEEFLSNVVAVTEAMVSCQQGGWSHVPSADLLLALIKRLEGNATDRAFEIMYNLRWHDAYGNKVSDPENAMLVMAQLEKDKGGIVYALLNPDWIKALYKEIESE